MPLVQAKCPNCGASLEVDSTKEAAVCQFCGSAYVVEKAIKIVQNATVINNYYANNTSKEEHVATAVNKEYILSKIDRELNKDDDDKDKKPNIEKCFDELFGAGLYDLDVLKKYWDCGYRKESYGIAQNIYLKSKADWIKDFFLYALGKHGFVSDIRLIEQYLPEELKNDTEICTAIENALVIGAKRKRKIFLCIFIPLSIAVIVEAIVIIMSVLADA